MGLCESREIKERRRQSIFINKQIAEEKKAEYEIQKLLLLGAAECGKSTILKQMRILHDSGFTKEEVALQRRVVYANIVEGMLRMLEARRNLGIHITDEHSNSNAATVMLWQSSNEDKEGPLSPEVYLALKALWEEETIQECYLRRSEYQLSDCVKYFFDNLTRIAVAEYKPTDQDILHTRAPTSGVSEVRFMVKDVTFRVFDVGGQRSERRKWIHCFDNVNAIIFIVAISEYDQVLIEDETTNRMHEALDLFKQIVNSGVFMVETSTILFLNKKDLFEEKLRRVAITVAFPEYTDKGDYITTITYIQQKFEAEKEDPKKVVYTHQTCATDTDQVQVVLEVVFEGIIAQNATGAGVE